MAEVVSMPKIRDKVMPGFVEFAGEKIRFEYKPGMIDDQHDKIINNARGENEAIYGAICRVVVSWNLGDDEGKKIPLKPEAIIEAGVPTPLMVAILEKYQSEAQNGGLQAKKS